MGMPSSSSKFNNSHSHDDMTADEIKKKQQRFSKSKSKKRHSHIGAMRHHSSKNKQKLLNLPADIKENDEKESSNKTTTASTMNSMMSSSATNKRLEQLMAM